MLGPRLLCAGMGSRRGAHRYGRWGTHWYFPSGLATGDQAWATVTAAADDVGRDQLLHAHAYNVPCSVLCQTITPERPQAPVRRKGRALPMRPAPMARPAPNVSQAALEAVRRGGQARGQDTGE